jgi:hypothetical protein
LDRDIEQYLQLRQQRKPTDGLTVPVPRRYAKNHDSRIQNYYIAPAANYSAKYGFLDKPLEATDEQTG